MLHCRDMPVARLLYTLLLAVALPAAALILLWRGRRHPGYRAHWRERFLGILPNGYQMAGAPPDSPAPRALAPGRPLVWIHAVSVGETRAAQPLVEALLAAPSGLRILMTHGTPTGRQTSEDLFGDRIQRGYLPYDLPWAVATFLAEQRPAAGLLMETEVWPNLIAACVAQRVPLCLVNARLSERSARGYGRLTALFRPAFVGLTRVLAQTDADADRLSRLGAVDVRITGNLKSDAEPDPRQIAAGLAWRAVWEAALTAWGGASRPVWLAASTREGEDTALIEAHQRLMAREPTALMVWVPRHPHRVSEIERALEAAGLTYARRGAGAAVAAEVAVWIGDTLGELAAYIATADVVFMGGSLVETGGQNLLEPFAQAKPVVVGPHTFNFLQLTRDAVARGAAIRVEDAAGLADAVAELLSDAPRHQAVAEAGTRFRNTHRGSLAATLAGISALLPQASASDSLLPGSDASSTGTR